MAPMVPMVPMVPIMVWIDTKRSHKHVHTKHVLDRNLLRRQEHRQKWSLICAGASSKSRSKGSSKRSSRRRAEIVGERCCMRMKTGSGKRKVRMDCTVGGGRRHTQS
jgi:hypothetical protein